MKHRSISEPQSHPQAQPYVQAHALDSDNTQSRSLVKHPIPQQHLSARSRGKTMAHNRGFYWPAEWSGINWPAKDRWAIAELLKLHTADKNEMFPPLGRIGSSWGSSCVSHFSLLFLLGIALQGLPEARRCIDDFWACIGHSKQQKSPGFKYILLKYTFEYSKQFTYNISVILAIEPCVVQSGRQSVNSSLSSFPVEIRFSGTVDVSRLMYPSRDSKMSTLACQR